MALEYFNLGNGINTYSSPLQGQDGQMIHGVNVVAFPQGGLSKRPGYNTFLGTPDIAGVRSLFSFPDQNGTTLHLYRAAGTLLYYSAQGTGAWTLCQGSAVGDSGGTIALNQHVGNALLNNTMIIGDGQGSTRHTTNGTQFSNTLLAPVTQHLTQFHNRVYTTDGTSSVLAYSVTNDATNWNTGGTSDSSSLIVPDEGACAKPFVAGDRLVIPKTRGKLFNWDDYSLVDMATHYGPSSPYSVAAIDNYWFYMNQYGIFGFDGANKQVLSNAVQRQFYNRGNTGIGTAAWGTAPAECHFWDYLLAVGTVTDDFTGRQIPNAIIKYDYQKNVFLNWSFTNAPTAFHSYLDISNKRQLIFGDDAGHTFQLDPLATSDNGSPIQTDMVYLFSYALQQQQFSPSSASLVSGMSYEKKWNSIRLFFNPGCEMNIQYAFSNTLTYQHLRWSEAINTRIADGDFWQVSDGAVEIRFPDDPNNPPRSRFLFVRCYESSDNSQWVFYGAQIDAEIQVIK